MVFTRSMTMSSNLSATLSSATCAVCGSPLDTSILATLVETDIRAMFTHTLSYVSIDMVWKNKAIRRFYMNKYSNHNRKHAYVYARTAIGLFLYRQYDIGLFKHPELRKMYDVYQLYVNMDMYLMYSKNLFWMKADRLFGASIIGKIPQLLVQNTRIVWPVMLTFNREFSDLLSSVYILGMANGF